jgi:hypothetical protein
MSGTFSALAFCSQALSVHQEWPVIYDLCGNDHFPINIHFTSSHHEERRHLNCAIKEADWMGFSQSMSFQDNKFNSIASVGDYFTSTIIQAETLYISLSSISPVALVVR